MICPRCGIINLEDAEHCKRCQGSLARPPAPAVRDEPAPAVTDQPVGPEPSQEDAEPPLADLPPPPDQQPVSLGAAPQAWPTPPYPVAEPTPAPSRPGLAIPNYLVQAVLCTVLFFPIGGLIAIVYGIRVNRRVAVEDWDGANHASRMARTWCWISVAVGVAALALVAAGVLPNPYGGG